MDGYKSIIGALLCGLAIGLYAMGMEPIGAYVLTVGVPMLGVGLADKLAKIIEGLHFLRAAIRDNTIAVDTNRDGIIDALDRQMIIQEGEEADHPPTPARTPPPPPNSPSATEFKMEGGQGFYGKYP